MLEFLAELIEVIIGLLIEALSKEGRMFLQDVGAILTGGKVKNHRWVKSVC